MPTPRDRERTPPRSTAASSPARHGAPPRVHAPLLALTAAMSFFCTLSPALAQQTSPVESPAAALQPPPPASQRRAVRFDGVSLWLEIPASWREISAAEIAQLNAILPPEQAVNKFIGGFASGDALGYPYLLVQRIPVRLQGRTAAQIAEGFNAVNIDDVRSGVERGLGDLIKNIALERPALDLQRGRMIQVLGGQAPDGLGGVVTFKTLSVSYLTNDAVIGVYQYDEAARFDSERAAFAAVADSAAFEPNILYVPAAAQAAGSPAPTTTNNSAPAIPLAALIGAGVVILVGAVIFITRKKNASPPAA